MEQRAYSYEELAGLKARILEICEQVARENPTAWRQAHNGNFDDDSTRYNDLCVQALRAAGIYAGCNGKRGGDQRSDDILAFGLSDGRGAQDRSGHFPSMAIIDFIGGAGGPNPSVGWNDVSQAAPGRFLDPQGLPRIDGGGTPAPGPAPTPTPTPVPVPPQNDDAVRDALRALQAQVETLADRIAAKVAEEIAPIKGTVDETYGGIFTESPNPNTPSLLQRVARTQEAVANIKPSTGAGCVLRGRLGAAQLAGLMSAANPERGKDEA